MSPYGITRPQCVNWNIPICALSRLNGLSNRIASLFHIILHLIIYTKTYNYLCATSLSNIHNYIKSIFFSNTISTFKNFTHTSTFFCIKLYKECIICICISCHYQNISWRIIQNASTYLLSLIRLSVYWVKLHFHSYNSVCIGLRYRLLM